MRTAGVAGDVRAVARERLSVLGAALPGAARRARSPRDRNRRRLLCPLAGRRTSRQKAVGSRVLFRLLFCFLHYTQRRLLLDRIIFS